MHKFIFQYLFRQRRNVLQSRNEDHVESEHGNDTPQSEHKAPETKKHPSLSFRPFSITSDPEGKNKALPSSL